MKKAVVYARVSTNREDQLNSLQTQMSFFEDYIKEQGYELADSGLLNRKDGNNELLQGIYADEGLTGTSLKNRRAFKQMMADAKKGLFNMIITKSVARFGRNVEDTVKAYKDLKELGIGVFFFDLKENSLDNSKEFIINLFATLAQEESNNKSTIIQFGIRKAQQQGKWTTGNPPFGYDIVNKYLVKNEYEAGIIKRIFEMYYDEGCGTGKICRWLNESGIQSKRGTKWSQVTISRILENPIYAGKQVTHKEQTTDVNRKIVKFIPEFEQIITINEDLRIISDDLFQQVQIEKGYRKELFGQIIIENKYVTDEDGELRVIKKRMLDRAGGRHSNELLYSNILYCGNCGSSLKRKKRRAYVRKDGTKRELGYEWACAMNDMYGSSRCSYRNSVNENELNQYVIEEIEKKKQDDSGHQWNLNSYIYTYLNKDHVQGEILKQQEALKEVQLQIDTNFRLVSKELISDDEYKERNDLLQEQKRNITSDLNRLLFVDKEIEETKKKFDNFHSFLKTIDTANLSNGVLKKVIDRIVVHTFDKSYLRMFQELKHKNIEWKVLDKSELELLGDMADKDMNVFNIIPKVENDIEEI